MQKSRFNPLYLLALFVLVAIWILSVSAIIAQDTPEPPPWHYEGEEGPENWGALGDGEVYALCDAGTAQSPIDITSAASLDLSNISFDYGDAGLKAHNNGHTLHVDVDADTNMMIYNGITYELKQFHFHHPSEHTVDGEHAPMEAHFVHQDINSGNLAVVGVMLIEGDDSPYSEILSLLPADDTVELSMDIAVFLPDDLSFTTYNGSLTTPACGEIVRWLVLDTPMTVSPELIEIFAEVIGENARPVQPLNGRDLLHDEG